MVFERVSPAGFALENKAFRSPAGKTVLKFTTFDPLV